MDIRLLRRIAKRGFYRTAPKRTAHPGAPSVVVAYNEHGAYCLPRAALHAPVCRQVMAGDVWEPRTLAFLCAHIGEGDIVHAGAFFGDFLPALSRAAALGAVVWTFEPLAESWRCAKATVALNDLANVELRQAALGAGGAELALRTLDKDGLPLAGGSFIAEAGETHAPQVRLDDVIPPDRRVTVLQLDVERHEAEALAGARGLLRRCRPLVVLETVPPDFAAEHGYVFERRLGVNSVFRPAA
jgi:FkbM family methyltransferase